MKPYGVPRHPDVECPDKLDITIYGLSVRGEKRKSKGKKRRRRIWKKLARLANKLLCKEEI